MFSCCSPTYLGSCFQKPRGEGFSRRLLSSRLRRLWPFTRGSPREAQGDLGQASPGQATSSSTQDTGREPTDWVLGSIPPKDGQVPPATKRLARAWGKNASRTSKTKTCVVQATQARRLDKLVGQLVPALLGGDPAFVPTFLGSYRTFATTQQVLDSLFTRYSTIFPYSEEDGGPLDQLKMAMASILATWLNWYPEDFFQPPAFPCLKMLVAYLGHNFPGSGLEHQAQELLWELEHLEPAQGDAKEPAPTFSTVPSAELGQAEGSAFPGACAPRQQLDSAPAMAGVSAVTPESSFCPSPTAF